MRYLASKYSMTLKTGLRVVQGHWKWRRLIDQYTTLYWSAIVNIVLSGTVFELFDVEWYRDLEIWIRGHSTSFKKKMVPFESLGTVSYSPSIVTMALSCISSEIKRDIGRKSWSVHTPLHSTPPLGGGSPSEYCYPVWNGKAKVVVLPDGGKLWGLGVMFRHNTDV